MIPVDRRDEVERKYVPPLRYSSDREIKNEIGER